MEPASFVASVVGLASLFNNVVDSFDYVHIAKSFGPNFQTQILMLDNARLRLSRWGEALGLDGGSIDDTTALYSNIWSEGDKTKAEKNLGQILDRFKEAYKISQKYKQENPNGYGQLDERKDSDLMMLSLREKMRDMSRKRQNRATMATKTKFALYDEKHLKQLVDDITKLTNALVELFPAQKPRQVELAAHEVSEFIEAFRVLSKAVIEQDKPLASALERIIKPADNLMTFNNERSNIVKQGTDTGGTYTVTMPSPW